MSRKSGERSKGERAVASSNWIALQKKLPKAIHKSSPNHDDGARKRRKLEHIGSPFSPAPNRVPSSIALPVSQPLLEEPALGARESLVMLRTMILGRIDYTENQQLPGKYLALDCEMVGVGIDGSESSLARVTLVNYFGAIQLDEFVRQRERVVDWRTQFSGVRSSDMIKAKPFDAIQQRVAELLKDRILIGHAVYNDLKALLLSHPRPQTRDTQYYAGKFKVSRSKYVALRNLVKQELDVTIQSGEHSSVTDARATMAVYRLHRKEWEKGNKQVPNTGGSRKKRKGSSGNEPADVEVGDDKDVQENTKGPLSGRKGVSSGLSTVIHRKGNIQKGGGDSSEKSRWWKELGNDSQPRRSIQMRAD